MAEAAIGFGKAMEQADSRIKALSSRKDGMANEYKSVAIAFEEKYAKKYYDLDWN